MKHLSLASGHVNLQSNISKIGFEVPLCCLLLESQQFVPPDLQPPHLKIAMVNLSFVLSQSMCNAELAATIHLSLSLVLSHPRLDLQLAHDSSPLLDHLHVVL